MNLKRTRTGIALTLATISLLSACGSHGPSATGAGSGSGGSSNTATNLEKAVKFSQCMRAKGVSEFPDPTASGQLTIDGVVNGSSLNPSSPAFQQALSGCRDLEPAGFMGSTRTAQQQEAALKFAQCMRNDGVPDFPDPTPDGPIIDTTRIPSLAGKDPRTDPGFNAAKDKCSATFSGQLGLRGQ